VGDRIRTIEAALRKAIDARGVTTPRARQVIYDAAECALARSKSQREAEGASDRNQTLRQNHAIVTKRIEHSLSVSRTGATLPEFDPKDEISMTQPSEIPSPPERSVTARASATDSVSIIYSTLGQGNSWQPQSLTSECTDISIDYAMPAVVGEPGEDYIGLSPAIDRSGDIKSVRLSLKQPG
jgi:hypothetical protein